MTFHEHLMYLRKQNGLSQEQLGAQVGVSRQTVSKWELGDTTPEMEKLIQLSEYFGISIDTLIGHEANETDSFSKAEKTSFHYHPYVAWHYEYKSKREFCGIPLVHINLGRGIYKAKGIIAIGSIARGLLSIGGVSIGALSFGAASMGLFSLGGASLGLLLSVGGLSAGTVAVGGLALGIFAVGGLSVGIYSIGGCAVAAKIAAGGYAHAPIAIGDGTSGQITFDVHRFLSDHEIRSAILEKYPHTWKFIVDLFSSFH